MRKITQQQAFTLLEMLVVLVLIGLVAGLVGPRLFGKVDESKIKATSTQIKMLKSSFEVMRLDINRYPTQQEGTQLLMRIQSGSELYGWSGPYLNDELPLDPWGNAYQYQLNSPNSYTLFSWGPDGINSEDDIS